MPNPTDSSPLTSSPDLAIDFCGIRCANPFILASSPVAHNYEMCVRALEAGWAGICFKTISFYPIHEVSPRFDQMEVDGVPFIGFKNMEQLSEASVEENFDTLYRLKQRYPDKLITPPLWDGQTMSGHGLPNIPRRLGPISLSATSLVHK